MENVHNSLLFATTKSGGKRREERESCREQRTHISSSSSETSSQRIGAVKQRALSPRAGSTRKEEKEETDAVVSTLLFSRDFFCGNGTLPSRFYSGI